MNSFLEKCMSVFFEKAERTIKPLTYAQIIVFISAAFAWRYSVIMYFMLGTGFLLMGIETFIIKEKKRKDYIIWIIIALLIYWIVIDYYFFY